MSERFEPRRLQRRTVLVAGGSSLLAACASVTVPGSTPAPVVTAGAAAAPLLPAPPISPAYRAELPPPAPREFRAAWVATVANIDWPSAPGLSAAQQRSEALAMMDRARQIGLNALVLQVRPACDAIYPSALEPWTEYLSGEQGKAPGVAGEAPWDPLAFWVAEAHRRGLELHAWFNPYRARHSSAKSPLVASHIGSRRPDLVKRYGDMLWMDPGEPEAAAHTLAVITDVLRRYDIDGVHIDDYFYPYPVTVAAPAASGPTAALGTATPGAAPGAPAAPPATPPTPPTPPAEVPFPDDPAYARYRLNDTSGASLSRDDWRRANVDRLVEQMHRTVRAVKPGVRFGISPFGVGKPALRPPGVIGFSQYDKLYADAERWLNQGWLDYWAPQLYWQIQREGLQFPVLLDYWVGQNTTGRHLWPGLFTSQVARSWPAREVLDQVDVLRSRAAVASGHIHFSMVALMQDRQGLATALRQGAYAQPALVPATPWLATGAATAPPAPQLRLAGSRVLIEAPAPTAASSLNRWAVWHRIYGVWRFSVLPDAERQFDTAGASTVAVLAVDRLGQTSERALLRLP